MHLKHMKGFLLLSIVQWWDGGGKEPYILNQGTTVACLMLGTD